MARRKRRKRLYAVGLVLPNGASCWGTATTRASALETAQHVASRELYPAPGMLAGAFVGHLERLVDREQEQGESWNLGHAAIAVAREAYNTARFREELPLCIQSGRSVSSSQGQIAPTHCGTNKPQRETLGSQCSDEEPSACRQCLKHRELGRLHEAALARASQ